MSRKNRSPEEQALRAKIRELLQESNISSMEDILHSAAPSGSWCGQNGRTISKEFLRQW